MLCGFEEPSDLATTSCMPSASQTARIGPPAMMPVPGRGRAQHARGRRRNGPSMSWCRVRPWRSGTRIMRALGLLGRLADGLGHLARLAAAVADPALAVADDHQRREAEAPAALHHLGHAVDADQLVDQLAVCRSSPAPVATRLARAMAISSP